MARATPSNTSYDWISRRADVPSTLRSKTETASGTSIVQCQDPSRRYPAFTLQLGGSISVAQRLTNELAADLQALAQGSGGLEISFVGQFDNDVPPEPDFVKRLGDG